MFKEITHDEALWKESLRQAYSFWGKPLTEEQFVLLVEKVHKFFDDSNHRLYGYGEIVDGELVASCKVLERPIYRGQGKYGMDYAVAMVYTSEKHRRKGHAERLVNSVVEKYGNDEDQVSLWSGVGDYYARCGFVLADAKLRTLVLTACAADSISQRQQGTYLTSEDIDSIVERHRMQLLDLADSVEGSVVLPSVGLYRSMQLRANLLLEMQGVPESAYVTAYGAVLGQAWMTWSVDLSRNRVLILGAEGKPTDIAQLLVMALHDGARFELAVEMYETTLVRGSLQAVQRALQYLHAECEIRKREKEWPMVVASQTWLAPGGYSLF